MSTTARLRGASSSTMTRGVDVCGREDEMTCLWAV